MAESPSSPVREKSDLPAVKTYGQMLPGGLNNVTSHISNCLNFMHEVREFVKERSVMERNYAKELDSVHRRFSNRLEKKMREISIGAQSSPNATGITTTMSMWADMLLSIERCARERYALSDRQLTDAGDKIKSVINKLEDGRRKHVAFANKMAAEVDKAASDREKARMKYLQVCEDVELSKIKYDKADDKNQEKLRKVWHQNIIEMNNAKNSYLLSIASYNSAVRVHEHDQLPWILDELEDLEATRLRLFKEIMGSYIENEQQTSSRCFEEFKSVAASVNAINIKDDLELYMEANHSDWHDPVDVQFEATTLFRDTSDIVVDEYTTVVLTNAHIKLTQRQRELTEQIAQFQKKVMGLTKLYDAYTENPRLGAPEEVKEELLELMRQLIAVQGQLHCNEAELQIIRGAIGGAVGEEIRPHNFKQTTPSLRTICNYCQTAIWGLSRSALFCKDCGYICHTKCELKVSGNCSGSLGPVVGPSEEAKASALQDMSKGVTTRSISRPTIFFPDITGLQKTGIFDNSKNTAASTTTGSEDKAEQVSPQPSAVDSGKKSKTPEANYTTSTSERLTLSSVVAKVGGLVIKTSNEASENPGSSNSSPSKRPNWRKSIRTTFDKDNTSSKANSAVFLDANEEKNHSCDNVQSTCAAHPASNPDVSVGAQERTENEASKTEPPKLETSLPMPIENAESVSSATKVDAAPAADSNSPFVNLQTGDDASWNQLSSWFSATNVKDQKDPTSTTPRKATIVAVALYDYEPKDETEIAIKAGQILEICSEETDGWFVARTGPRPDQKGYVPASYAQELEGALSGRSYALVAYNYDAQAESEVSVEEGDVVELVKDEGNGWIEVRVRGTVGQVPKSYAQVIQIPNKK